MNQTMKKISFIFGCLCVFLYLSTLKEETASVSVEQKFSNHYEIVLADADDTLIPFTVSSNCTGKIACLNEALGYMSCDMNEYQGLLPEGVEVISVVCEQQCTVDVTKEFYELNPSDADLVMQSLGYLFQQFGCERLTVQGNEVSDLSQGYLNHAHVTKQDYHRGQLIQLYTTQKTENQSILVPVLLHFDLNDPIEMIRQYYQLNYSVLFDQQVFRTFDLIEEEVLTLRFSQEALYHGELQFEYIEPVLHAIKKNTDYQTVRIEVQGVVVDEVDLSSLMINQLELFQ